MPSSGNILPYNSGVASRNLLAIEFSFAAESIFLRQDAAWAIASMQLGRTQ
jgi:hypothetical protein